MFMKKSPQNFYALLLLLIFSSCKKEQPDVISKKEIPLKSKHEIQPVKNPEESKTYHVDSTFKYEYRTGESGNYQYHYDVIGENSKGEKVTGEVDMEGKYGKGTLSDQTKIDAEWIDKGEIKAQDAKGNVYELIVE